MRVEAILSREDLARVAAQFAPISIALRGEGSLVITDPSDLTLEPGVGVRLACKARLRWSVLGIVMPVTIRSVIAVVRPEIVRTASAQALVFRLQIERADLAGLPDFVDRRVTDKVNAELAERQLELAWNFTETLSHAFKLPTSIAPLETFGLTAVDARVSVTADAMALAVAFESRVTRHAEDVATPNHNPSDPTPN
jgi:hypothetical protein